MWEGGEKTGGGRCDYKKKKIQTSKRTCTAARLKETFINHLHLNVNKWQMARLNRLSGAAELVRLAWAPP